MTILKKQKINCGKTTFFQLLGILSCCLIANSLVAQHDSTSRRPTLKKTDFGFISDSFISKILIIRPVNWISCNERYYVFKIHSEGQEPKLHNLNKLKIDTGYQVIRMDSSTKISMLNALKPYKDYSVNRSVDSSKYWFFGIIESKVFVLEDLVEALDNSEEKHSSFEIQLVQRSKKVKLFYKTKLVILRSPN